MSAPSDAIPSRHPRVAGGPVVELLLDPGRFFPEGARRLKGPLFFALIVLLGMSSVVDRLDLAALRSTFSGGPARILESWLQYWTAVVVGSAIAAPLSYWIGGWWYWMRVRFSGVDRPDGPLARHVYLLSSSVATVTTLTLALQESWRYSDPMSAWDGTEPVAVTLFVVPFWTIFVSYRGVVASFPVSRARARLWFAVLPALFYAAVMGVGALLGIGAI